MTLIYSENSSNRLVYTLDFVFNEHGLTYELTHDLSYFNSFSGNKLAYAKGDSFESDVQITPANLLFETSIQHLEIEQVSWNEIPCLAFHKVCDPLAAVFFVLSRFEEYLPFQADNHGRYCAQSSVLYRFGWLHEQIVERWVEAIVTKYASDGIDEFQLSRKVNFMPTFDIDVVYAHLLKGNFRNFFAASKDLVKGNIQQINSRRKVLQQQLKDPYDSYDSIAETIENHQETRVFWHIGVYGKYDKNASRSNPDHQRLIRYFSGIGNVGLHPSYVSNTSAQQLKHEIKAIRLITTNHVVESRQHFLKLSFPSTYMRMIEYGFESDFSMGYADAIGFRAGTAHTHSFFNVIENKHYPNYRIVPFCYMDGTLKDYLKYTPEQSLKSIAELMREVKRYGGNFAFIWHNHSLAEADSWKGWRRVFDETLRLWNNMH
jgi:hypothetical protein